MSTSLLPKQMIQDLMETLGPDRSRWPEEARDLFDTTIEAQNIAPSISGRVEKFLNTDFHYHWAADTALNHERVESMRWAGWEFATTDDVKMCSEASVVGRIKDRKSRDGGNGFSDEIRNGDRRLMKLPMSMWRANRKAQNIAAFQMAYPKAIGPMGNVTAPSDVTPGVRTESMDPAAIDDTRRRANSGNSVLAQSAKER